MTEIKKPEYHSIKIDLATRIGLYPTILFRSIGYWAREIGAREKVRGLHEVEAWFPYLTSAEIKAGLAALGRAGLVNITFLERDGVPAVCFSLTPAGEKEYGKFTARARTAAHWKGME